MQTFKNILFVWLTTLSTIIYAGFSGDTLIKTPDGYKKIETIKQDDFVVCYDEENDAITSKPVVSIHKKICNHAIDFTIHYDSIRTTRTQLFYDGITRQWITLERLLASNKGEFHSVNSQEHSEITAELYELSVKDCHNFYITEHNILVHNFAPVLFMGAVSVTAGQSLISAVSVLLGALTLNFLHKKHGSFLDLNNFKTTTKETPPNNTCPDQEPDDKDGDFFEKLKKRSDKIVRSKRFGKLYRDPESGLWWSLDRAGHGGKHCKVFAKKATAFEWQFNADMQGIRIINQHKSPVGMFISFKDIIG